MKKLLKDINGTTLFEALTGIAILTIVSVMLLAGFMTAQKIMGQGNEVQTKINTNQTSVEALTGVPTATTAKNYVVFVDGEKITITGHIKAYGQDTNMDHSSMLGTYIND